MPKTLTGEELQLDDGPARDAELFLVDGNNLAYRAYFALPEELATSEGFPTNALLGFVNMLFKLLVDYQPKGVAVAWDTRPVHRLEAAEEYKAERRPMPDLLREQFPYFRPLVEAFGYRNLAFEGWEADDVIATLASRADAAEVKTCVVSTDRDAFQLCSDNVSLMMTPRGVADVQVYTPERVEARYGVPPAQVPDFIGLKGDTSDNIPGVPGIGDKTAGQLIAQFGSLEEVLAHVDELSPARAQRDPRARRPGAPLQAARDDAARPRHRFRPGGPRARAAGPLELKEMFRRFEFRNAPAPGRRARRGAAVRRAGSRRLTRRSLGRRRVDRLAGPAAVAVTGGSAASRGPPADRGRPARGCVAPRPGLVCHGFAALPRSSCATGSSRPRTRRSPPT